MRFHGKVGFVDTVKGGPGIVEQQVVCERYYYGDVLRWTPRTTPSSNQANDEIEISNQISIVADSYANRHLHTMKYVNWSGVNWRIRSVNVNYPRLILEIGGVYPETEEAIDNDAPEYQD